MGLLKKLGRGIKRVAKKNAGGLSRLAKKVGPGLVLSAVAPVAAPLIVKAASAAKTLGKKARGLETPKSLVPVVRAAQVRVKKTRSKMPGGAPMPSMPTIGTPAIGMMSSRPQAKRKLYDRPARQGRGKRGKRIEYQTPADIRAGGGARPGAFKKKKRSGSSKAPSPAQLKARENFKKMVAARRKKAA